VRVFYYLTIICLILFKNLSAAKPDPVSPYASAQNRIQAIIRGRIVFNENLAQVLCDPAVPFEGKKRLSFTEEEYSHVKDAHLIRFISCVQNETENYKQLLRISVLRTQKDVDLFLCLVRRFIHYERPIHPRKQKFFEEMDYIEVGYFRQMRDLLTRHSDDEAVDFVEKSVRERIIGEPPRERFGYINILLLPSKPKAERNFEVFFSQLALQDPFCVDHRRSMFSLQEQFGGLNDMRGSLIESTTKEFSFLAGKPSMAATPEQYQIAAAICLEIYGFDQKIKKIEDASRKILQLIAKRKQAAEKQRLAEEKREKAEKQQRKSKASKAAGPSKPTILEESPPPSAEEAAPVGAPEAIEPLEEHPLERAIETIRAAAAKAQAPIPARRTEPQPPAQREHDLVRTILGRDPIKSGKFMSELASFLHEQPLPEGLAPAEIREARQIMNRGGSKRLASLYGPAGELSLCYFHEPHGRDDDIHPRDFMWKNIHSSLDATGYLSAAD